MNNTATDQNKAMSGGIGDKQQIALIASHLMQALHIPQGSHLVRFFGSGQEQNNRQALIRWIEIHIDEIDPDETETRLKHLAKKQKTAARKNHATNK